MSNAGCVKCIKRDNTSDTGSHVSVRDGEEADDRYLLVVCSVLASCCRLQGCPDLAGRSHPLGWWCSGGNTNNIDHHQQDTTSSSCDIRHRLTLPAYQANMTQAAYPETTQPACMSLTCRAKYTNSGTVFPFTSKPKVNISSHSCIGYGSA